MTTLLAMIALGAPTRPLFFVHVMPWFEATPQDLGYHWKMNRTSEEMIRSQRVASHFRPLIGAYDSLDPAVVDLQIHWIKLSGFDGVLADWYGTLKVWDYPMIHERTKLLFRAAERAGLQFAVVYEDQAPGNAIREKQIPPEQLMPTARETGVFLRENWFKSPRYWRVDGKPVVKVFGPQAFREPEWAAFRESAGPMNLLTLHHRQPYAEGVYDWPVPKYGLAFNADFAKRAQSSPIKVGVAFPRFVDWYEEGGREGYPDLPDRDGATYRETLAQAIAQGGQAIQVATWNDWQEGTQIEPSVELGTRDLRETQEARRRLDRGFAFRASDLDLPLRLYRLRKEAKVDAKRLDEVARALDRGETRSARRLLDRIRQ